MNSQTAPRYTSMIKNWTAHLGGLLNEGQWHEVRAHYEASKRQTLPHWERSWSRHPGWRDYQMERARFILAMGKLFDEHKAFDGEGRIIPSEGGQQKVYDDGRIIAIPEGRKKARWSGRVIKNRVGTAVEILPGSIRGKTTEGKDFTVVLHRDVYHIGGYLEDDDVWDIVDVVCADTGVAEGDIESRDHGGVVTVVEDFMAYVKIYVESESQFEDEETDDEESEAEGQLTGSLQRNAEAETVVKAGKEDDATRGDDDVQITGSTIIKNKRKAIVEAEQDDDSDVETEAMKRARRRRAGNAIALDVENSDRQIQSPCQAPSSNLWPLQWLVEEGPRDRKGDLWLVLEHDEYGATQS